MSEHTSSYHLQPKTAEIIGTELAILWNDGLETYISLDVLRRACPCASCGGEPNILGQVVRPVVRYHTNSFEMRSLNWVGGYALQPIWLDGHDSGLYSYSLLKQLHA